MVELNNTLEAKIMKDRGTVKIRDAKESLPIIPKKVPNELGSNLQQAISDTNFPITKEVNGTKYAYPFADVDKMISEYSRKVIAIKRYALAKGIACMEMYIANGTAKAKNLEDWANKRLDELKKEEEVFNKAHPMLQIVKGHIDIEPFGGDNGN
ncbi:hypothetical protein [Ruminobacter amylophilus]|uniref:hypothetical protein n=1 Tax=Ruminobacter amylophilus TaxID=867 RepID=UPI0038698F19